MERIVLSLAIFFGISSSAFAQSQEPLKVQLAVGLGWQLCPKTNSLPPLGLAFYCSGLAATTDNLELELINKPAAHPDWLYWEATHFETVKFQDITSTVELLVMFAKYDGKSSAFIDGRIVSEKAGVKSEPVYFRMSADGGFENLKYTSAYGATVAVTGMDSRFSPYVAVQAKH
jgi:hypothetical protein